MKKTLIRLQCTFFVQFTNRPYLNSLKYSRSLSCGVVLFDLTVRSNQKVVKKINFRLAKLVILGGQILMASALNESRVGWVEILMTS